MKSDLNQTLLMSLWQSSILYVPLIPQDTLVEIVPVLGSATDSTSQSA